MLNPIIAQTAKDYDLPYHIVENAYTEYIGINYAKLEQVLIDNR